MKSTQSQLLEDSFEDCPTTYSYIFQVIFHFSYLPVHALSCLPPILHSAHLNLLYFIFMLLMLHEGDKLQFFITQISKNSCHFLPFRFKYSPNTSF